MDHVIGRTSGRNEILDIQGRLRALGFHIQDEPGTFGPATKNAVSAFQQQRFLLVDGIVGPQTWHALVEASWRLGDRVLYLKRPYMRGDDVAALQRSINALGFDAGREDGIFGPLAYAAIRAFQKEYGIPEDGIYGFATHAALSGLRVDRPGTTAGIREDLRHRHGRGLEGELIVIDPGHGGDDLGVVGRGGLTEAETCWDLGAMIANRLARYGAKVRFSRQEPEAPDDSERARRANELDADLVLSVHLNSHEEPNADGSSTYHFVTSRAGEALADSIQSQLVKDLGCRDCRTHARSYTILRETRAPAVIIEPAFITNPKEEELLARHDHRVALADAVVDGVRSYAGG